MYSFSKLYACSADNKSASCCNLAKSILVAVFLPNNTSKAFFVALIPVSFSNLASASLYVGLGCLKNVSAPLLYFLINLITSSVVTLGFWLSQSP